jgi:hypothetical protein
MHADDVNSLRGDDDFKLGCFAPPQLDLYSDRISNCRFASELVNTEAKISGMHSTSTVFNVEHLQHAPSIFGPEYPPVNIISGTVNIWQLQPACLLHRPVSPNYVNLSARSRDLKNDVSESDVRIELTSNETVKTAREYLRTSSRYMAGSS